MAHLHKNVLVVDDVEDWQKTIEGLLTDEGHHVTLVSRRETALKAIKANKFDLAIVDIRLDERDETNTAGLDLAGELKNLQKDLSVVILTGYETLETIARALKPNEYGERLADDFVPKTNADELVNIVSRIW